MGQLHLHTQCKNHSFEIKQYTLEKHRKPFCQRKHKTVQIKLTIN